MKAEDSQTVDTSEDEPERNLGGAVPGAETEAVAQARTRVHCFVHYADDSNVYVRSQKAGERVMHLLKRYYEKLHLRINKSKSAVVSVFGCKFLGYALWQAGNGEVRRGVSGKALEVFKRMVRQLTQRSGGRSMALSVGMVRVLWAGTNPANLAIAG